METKIKIQLSKGAKPPQYMTSGSVGADLYAYTEQPIEIPHGEYRAIPTGIAIELPLHYEAQIRPRSGLAAKHGLTILNSPGTIDSDYRGEIIVLLVNHGKENYTIHAGDRIAQIVIAPIVQATFLCVDVLSSTERDNNGFGHTGI